MVEAGVIAEWALDDAPGAGWRLVVVWRQAGGGGRGGGEADGAGLVGDEALDDDVGVGGDPERDGLGTGEADGPACEEAGHQEFGDAGRERGGRGIGQDGLSAEGDGDGHGPPERFP